MIPRNIHTESDVTDFWKAAMGELGFADTRLYFVLIAEDGEIMPVVNCMDDNPDEPDDDLVTNLGETLAMFVAQFVPGGSVALLWARPGGGPMDDTDRTWAREITNGLRRHHVESWPFHFANDHYLRIIAADDIAA